jgi:DAACS family dicarboxylate/amino acid:cation (Na+ or H+) symporter
MTGVPPVAESERQAASAGSRRQQWMLGGAIAGTLLGMAASAWAPGAPWLLWTVANVAQPAGQLFLRLIFMAVVPLVFSSLVLGTVELGGARGVGRVGMKTLVCTLVASTASVLIGVTLVNWLEPGAGVDPALRSAIVGSAGELTARAVENARAAQGVADALLSLIPRNPVAAAAGALDGEMIALMTFAVIFGAALAQVRSDQAGSLLGVLTGVQQASLRIVEWAMALAPIGVAGLLFAAFARSGPDLLVQLGAYVGIVLVGLGIQLFLVYGAALRFVARVDPRRWFARCRPVVVTAFSTSSSSATLPQTLVTAERDLQIPPRIGNFVLTVGATANQNGTALFEGVTVLFLAQAFGVQLDLSAQVTVVLMSVLAGVGTAGVPGGSLPLIVILLQTIGVPGEAIGLVLGVDRFLDMCRTVVNVVGDLVCATVVARLEGELPEVSG